MTEASRVDFAGCYSSRLILLLDALAVPFIDLAHLRLNKLASGRPRDLADLEDLPNP